MKSKRIKIVERKLGRERAYGQAWMRRKLIEIDPRLKPKLYLEILLHEALHLVFPRASERKVCKSAKVLADVAWKKGFRKIAQ